MRTIDDLEVSLPRTGSPPITAARRRFIGIDRRYLLIIGMAVILGLGLRVHRLDSAGLAEDEANKMFALRAYAQGDFTVNTEHPMLMKLLCYVSVHCADVWNQAAGSRFDLLMSEETALRLPNAVFGALTTIPIFLLASALLGHRVGLLSAVLWAVGLDAIWFNRIAKEDTLLVFFMITGYYLYNVAKRQPEDEPERGLRFYALAGAAFGLMFASKYFIHFFGLNFIYYTIVGYDRRNNRPLTAQSYSHMFGAMMLVFAAVNPALFFPQTWRYLWRYINEELLTHHGYSVMDKLFINEMSQTPGGNPWYFYLLFLGVKVPTPLLIAFLVGLVEIFRRRGFYPYARGRLFLRVMLVFWLVPMSIVGAKFLRYSLSLMPLLYMTSAVGIIASWKAVTSATTTVALGWRSIRWIATAAMGIAFVIAPGVSAARSIAFSHPALFVSAAGTGRLGYFFPHDEFYDVGARESIKFVAEAAPERARFASEIPGVVDYYLEKFGRSDIRSEIISQPGFSIETAPGYVLLQPGRLYLENLDTFRRIEKEWQVAQTSDYEGAVTARIYQPPPSLIIESQD